MIKKIKCDMGITHPPPPRAENVESTITDVRSAGSRLSGESDQVAPELRPPLLEAIKRVITTTLLHLTGPFRYYYYINALICRTVC